MKSLNNFSYYFFWAIFILTLYTLLRLLNDSLDLDIGGMGRSIFFNSLLMKFFLPAIIIIFSIWCGKLIEQFKSLAPPKKFDSGTLNLPTILWWIPVLNLFAPIAAFGVVKDNIDQTDLDTKNSKKLRSGMNWIKTGFVLFYTLALMGFSFYYFVERNKDGHDLFMNLTFIFILFLSTGAIRMSSAIMRLTINTDERT